VLGCELKPCDAVVFSRKPLISAQRRLLISREMGAATAPP